MFVVRGGSGHRARTWMYSVLAWSFPQLANYKKLDKQYRGAVKKHSGTVARLEAHGLKLEECE